MKFQHGGRRDDSGNLIQNCVHVVEGHVVGRAGIVRPHDGAATILQLDLVRAKARERVKSVLLAR